MVYIVGLLLLLTVGIFVCARIIYSRHDSINPNMKKIITPLLLFILIISLLLNVMTYVENARDAYAVEVSHDRFMEILQEDIKVLRDRSKDLVEVWQEIDDKDRQEKIDGLKQLSYNVDFFAFYRIGQSFGGQKYGMQIYYDLWDYTYLDSSLRSVFYNTKDELISKQELTALIHDLDSLLNIFYEIEEEIEKQGLTGEEKIREWIRGFYEARQPLKGRGKSPMLRDWHIR